MDKIRIRGDVYDEFSHFNEINDLDPNSTDKFKDGLSFFGIQVLIDEEYWNLKKEKLLAL